jgi:hypothetical protein
MCPSVLLNQRIGLCDVNGETKDNI